MHQPIIFIIDDDHQVLNALNVDLKEAFRSHYKILSTTSVRDAMESLPELKNAGETVALFLTDQRMPEMEGVHFLEQAMDIFPEAKKVLLTAYSDTNAAIKAINDVSLDYYLLKPWDPPEEKLFPVLQDLLDDWKTSYRPPFKGIRVIGYQFSPSSHQTKEFLAGNLVPFRWLDIETTQEASDLIKLNNIETKDLPAVFLEDGSFLLSPSIPELAKQIGLSPVVKNNLYDVVIIGAGPAGLAAAVYGASEGLKTLLIERQAPGGQAGTSSRIENYLGFPAGLSGAELTRRAMTQAIRLGAELLIPHEVKEIHHKDRYKRIILNNDLVIDTHTVVITTGVDYRKLETTGVPEFTGAGIYYGAAMTEAAACKEKEVMIVGGGNSAGQAAMYLSKFAEKVSIVIRRKTLKDTMSSYLIDQISSRSNIELIPCAKIAAAIGDGKLQQVELKSLENESSFIRKVDVLYIFIGAKPYTDWIGTEVIKNAKGFLPTGRDLKLQPDFGEVWKLSRDPYLLETSCPGIFAAGDVRAGSMSRVASAVGEGSMAISFVHKYLTEV
jgi:thioredoxin reductase (NADPH)